MEFVRLQQLSRPDAVQTFGQLGQEFDSESSSSFAQQHVGTKQFENFRPRVEGLTCAEREPVVALAYTPYGKKAQLAVAHGTKISFWNANKAASNNKGGAASKKKRKGATATSSAVNSVPLEAMTEPAYSVNKFKDLATCLSVRADGKLLVAGEAGGSLAVLEWEEGSVLRRLKGHSNAPLCCGFSSGLTQILSGGKDRTLRLYDISASSNANLLTWNHAHADFVKALAPSPDQPFVWLTGGAEGVCKLWDSRIDNRRNQSGSGTGVEGSISTPGAAAHYNGCIGSFGTTSSGASDVHKQMVLDPVEAVAWYPGSTMFVSAAGTSVRVWDVRKGGNDGLLSCFGSSHHTKELTDVSVSESGDFIVSGSLDHTCRVWDARSYGHVYAFAHESAVSKCSFGGSDDFLAVGQQNGRFTVRKQFKPKRNPDGSISTQKITKKKKIVNKAAIGQPLTTRYYKRGQAAEPEAGDEVVNGLAKKQKLTHVEHSLRKFQYRKALQQAISCGSFSYALSFLDELESRSATRQAVSGLSDQELLDLLQWLGRVIDLGEAVCFRKLIANLFEELCRANEEQAGLIAAGGLVGGSSGSYGSVGPSSGSSSKGRSLNTSSSTTGAAPGTSASAVVTNSITGTASLTDSKNPFLLRELEVIRGKVNSELNMQQKTLRPLLGILDTLLSQ
ncbi:unnamed protein product [Amoebophrya sp. A25]|nr:unnamed protein product [Amoebophrya sp. A25]|eukprot:GSA25T00002751001.1